MTEARQALAQAISDENGDGEVFPVDLESADRILAALAKAGFKVLGREPTEEMLAHYDEKLLAASIFVTGGQDVWRTMWDAAAPPPKEGAP